MEFCYGLDMSLSCGNEVHILMLNNNKSHRQIIFYIFFTVLTGLGLSDTDTLNYETNLHVNQILNN